MSFLAPASSMGSPLSSAPVSRGSSPLSDLGRTPSPPPVYENIHVQRPSYPSPPASSQTSSQRSTPTPHNNIRLVMTGDRDGPPLAKRRRISKEPKERVTQHIDLREGTIPEQEETLQRVMDVLHTRRKIVVIAGAGMSVSAGST
nr:nad-dependent protein deacetylase hst4 [Quercus suber]